MSTKKTGKDQKFFDAVYYLNSKNIRTIQDSGWTWAIEWTQKYTIFINLNGTNIVTIHDPVHINLPMRVSSIAEPELLDKMYTFFIDYANQIRQKEDEEEAAKKEVESREINNLLAGWVESRGCK